MKQIILLIALTVPILSSAQHIFPVRWETKAIQVDVNIFEIHLKCTIDSGYSLYEPNRQDICTYSPLIKFERSDSWSALDGIDALSFEKKNEIGKCSTSGTTPLCNLASYEGNVTFIMVVRRNSELSQRPEVRGRIEYTPISNTYMHGNPTVASFNLLLETPENQSIGPRKCEEVPTPHEIRQANRQLRKMRKKYPQTYCPGFPKIL